MFLTPNRVVQSLHSECCKISTSKQIYEKVSQGQPCPDHLRPGDDVKVRRLHSRVLNGNPELLRLRQIFCGEPTVSILLADTIPEEIITGLAS